MDPLAGPLLCDPSRKAELEARNGDDQLDYITDLVDRGAQELRESHVLTLQEFAIREIYPCGGRYRDATKDVFIQNSRHQLPDVAFVPSLVRDAVDWINRETGRSALETEDRRRSEHRGRVVQPDFSPMVGFLRRMLMRQFAAAIDHLGSPSQR